MKTLKELMDIPPDVMDENDVAELMDHVTALLKRPSATFKLNKRCKSCDKYDEVDADGKVLKGSAKQPLLGTIYVSKEVAQGRDTITVEVQ